MKNKTRKATQRAINKIFRQVNKAIERDYLWQGRFKLYQLATYWTSFEDKSGGALCVKYKMVDTETGRERETFESFTSSGVKKYPNLISYKLNEFITVDCHDDVWGNEKFRERAKEITGSWRVKNGI